MAAILSKLTHINWIANFVNGPISLFIINEKSDFLDFNKLNGLTEN